MDAPEKAEAVTVEAVPSAGKKGGALLPLLAVIILVPVLCYLMMDFLVIPKLKSSVGVLLQASEAKSGAPAGKTAAKKEGKGAQGQEATGEHTVDFGPTIVNLAGTASARYLRVNFVVASSDPGIEDIIKEHQSALRDAAINVLSAQTLNGLDGEGARNAVRNQLIDQFNRTLGSQIVGQIYFSEFVVQ
jgi:flagellar basal body-associated protein FliL